MEPVFEVNTGSLDVFLRQYLSESLDERGQKASAYYKLRDELICKKELPVRIGSTVKISLSDEGRNLSGRVLIHSYSYTVEQYDSISIKLVLTNFNVSCQNA